MDLNARPAITFNIINDPRNMHVVQYAFSNGIVLLMNVDNANDLSDKKENPLMAKTTPSPIANCCKIPPRLLACAISFFGIEIYITEFIEV